jgi:uncharacterized phage protein (TIGR01671 family)
MKEIKFRAWDELNNKMEYLSLLGLHYEYSNQLTVYGVEDKYGKVSRTAPVMQFTGLKDKNGKEIWEGDIVTQQNIVEEIYVVKFEEVILDCFHCLGWNITNWSDKKIASNTEVIGNIYQNPELLEKIK